MDNIFKYIQYKYDNKNPFEIVQRMISKGRSLWYVVKKILRKNFLYFH